MAGLELTHTAAVDPADGDECLLRSSETASSAFATPLFRQIHLAQERFVAGIPFEAS
jgi:hypothetical protein